MRAYEIHGETSTLCAGPNPTVSCDQRGDEHRSYYLTRSDPTRRPRYDDETR
jgi:hypothetical protein